MVPLLIDITSRNETQISFQIEVCGTTEIKDKYRNTERNLENPEIWKPVLLIIL